MCYNIYIYIHTSYHMMSDSVPLSPTVLIWRSMARMLPSSSSARSLRSSWSLLWITRSWASTSTSVLCIVLGVCILN